MGETDGIYLTDHEALSFTGMRTYSEEICDYGNGMAAPLRFNEIPAYIRLSVVDLQL